MTSTEPSVVAADRHVKRPDVETIYRYDRAAYPFEALVGDVVRSAVKELTGARLGDLTELHRHVALHDLEAIYNRIYALFHAPEFREPYERLGTAIVNDLFDGEAAFQQIPSARIQLAGNRTVNFHTDQWYGHGPQISKCCAACRSIAPRKRSSKAVARASSRCSSFR